LRQFHLLMAEWKLNHKLQDFRFYQLFRAWVEKPPEPGDIFPMLAESAVGGDSGYDDDFTLGDYGAEDDRMVAQTVMASLGAQ